MHILQYRPAPQKGTSKEAALIQYGHSSSVTYHTDRYVLIRENEIIFSLFP